MDMARGMWQATLWVTMMHQLISYFCIGQPRQANVSLHHAVTSSMFFGHRPHAPLIILKHECLSDVSGEKSGAFRVIYEFPLRSN